LTEAFSLQTLRFQQHSEDTVHAPVRDLHAPVCTTVSSTHGFHLAIEAAFEVGWPFLFFKGTQNKQMIQFCRTRSDAVIPTRAGPDEVGYDLTLIEYERAMGANSHMFDTGISVQSPPGYFCMVVPRSSIVKRGVILSNSVGIIDPTYTGALKVVLSEVRSGALEALRQMLPITLCQLVFLPMLPAAVQAVEVPELQTTNRGNNGFGSTDRK
jgi:dUTP pyrophosphatase